MQLAARCGGDDRVVGYDDQSHAGTLVYFLEELENVQAVPLVEAAGGLVGENDGRFDENGALV